MAFEDLYRMQAWLMINSTEAYYSKIVCTEVRRPIPLHRLQHHCDGWPTSRPLAARRRRRALPSTWPFTWPLTHNWDHGVIRMRKVGYGNLTVNEERQWEESGVSVKNAWHHCCMYDPLISDGRSVSRCPVPSNQAHQWTDRCEPIRLYGWLPSPCDVTQGKGRCHVSLHGRPCSSFDCQRRWSAAVIGSSETAHFGGWTKILHFTTHI